MNVNVYFQIENNKVRAENDKLKENLNAEISNDENKKVNFSHEKNMAEQKNATLVQVNNLPSHNLNLTSILHDIRFYYWNAKMPLQYSYRVRASKNTRQGLRDLNPKSLCGETFCSKESRNWLEIWRISRKKMSMKEWGDIRQIIMQRSKIRYNIPHSIMFSGSVLMYRFLFYLIIFIQFSRLISIRLMHIMTRPVSYTHLTLPTKRIV